VLQEGIVFERSALREMEVFSQWRTCWFGTVAEATAAFLASDTAIMIREDRDKR
jgi:hypothetical protein